MGEEGESTISIATDEEVNLNIRCSNGSKFSVRSSLQLSVAEFKGVLSRSSDVPAEQQRLIYKGCILKDDQSLDSYVRDIVLGLVVLFHFAETNGTIVTHLPHSNPSQVSWNGSITYVLPHLTKVFRLTIQFT